MWTVASKVVGYGLWLFAWGIIYSAISRPTVLDRQNKIAMVAIGLGFATALVLLGYIVLSLPAGWEG